MAKEEVARAHHEGSMMWEEDAKQHGMIKAFRTFLPENKFFFFSPQVSTKTGLDTTGAWHAWGMACLKAGNLTAAREKFSRCLKPPLDLNQLSHGSRLVQDVVEYLESTVRPLLSLVRTQ